MTNSTIVENFIGNLGLKPKSKIVELILAQLYSFKVRAFQFHAGTPKISRPAYNIPTHVCSDHHIALNISGPVARGAVSGKGRVPDIRMRMLTRHCTCTQVPLYI